MSVCKVKNIISNMEHPLDYNIFVHENVKKNILKILL